MAIHPLVFEPILKPKMWGGRRLETVLGKPLPPGQLIGESWEIADLENDQSVVAAGPSAGKMLGELVHDWGDDLIGRAEPFNGRFPLLIKFLDAAESLSVQVHPDEAMARKLGGNVRVKHEAWYVIAAEPGAAIFCGLAPEITEADFRRAITEGTVERTLRRVASRAGDCYYLPSGTLHALGAGVLVAEVQTPSDVTYRVFDWHRIDSQTGKPRALHIEQALKCIRFGRIAEPRAPRSHVAGLGRTVTRLMSCEFFVIDKVRTVEGIEAELELSEMLIWIVLEGAGSLSCPALSEPIDFGVGSVLLLPAKLRDGRIRTSADCLWLEIGVPAPGSAAC